MLCSLSFLMFKKCEKTGQQPWLGFEVRCVQRTADLVLPGGP